MDLLVDSDWLESRLGAPHLRVIEAPWKADGFARAHIKGASVLPCHSYLKSLDAKGERTPFLVSQDEFLEILHKLGLKKSDHVVVYDDYHCLFATRLWWVFRYYGFSNVSVLNGGWQEWLEKGLPIEAKFVEYSEGSNFVPKIDGARNVSLKELFENFEHSSLQIWDARRREEYVGEEETSNKRVGHIPGAIHLNWTDLLEGEMFAGSSRRIKSLEELRQICEAAGFEKESTIVCHCQASIRGAFASFVLELLGYPHNKVYDGAMAEWANLETTPLEI